mmetsp:Transcript_10924/g.28093  ORF Transcript_10924/g.28093 Transcript_10924/m.28093 type:complete len:314 (-) Transcript_10924:951-1892(-)
MGILKAALLSKLKIPDKKVFVQEGAYGLWLEVVNRVKVRNVDTVAIRFRALRPVLLHMHPEEANIDAVLLLENEECLGAVRQFTRVRLVGLGIVILQSVHDSHILFPDGDDTHRHILVLGPNLWMLPKQFVKTCFQVFRQLAPLKLGCRIRVRDLPIPGAVLAHKPLGESLIPQVTDLMAFSTAFRALNVRLFGHLVVPRVNKVCPLNRLVPFVSPEGNVVRCFLVALHTVIHWVIQTAVSGVHLVLVVPLDHTVVFAITIQRGRREVQPVPAAKPEALHHRVDTLLEQFVELGRVLMDPRASLVVEPRIVPH